MPLRCRLVPMAESVKTLLVVFPTIAAASTAVGGIIARRIIPAALEKMDRLAENRGLIFFFLVFLIPGLPDDIACFAAGSSVFEARTRDRKSVV